MRKRAAGHLALPISFVAIVSCGQASDEPPASPTGDAAIDVPQTTTDAAPVPVDAAIRFTPQPGFSVDGTLADGGTMTIRRSAGGFGTKPNAAAPLLWAPMDGSSAPSKLGRLSAWGGTPGFTYQSTGGSDGGGFLKGVPSTGNSVNNWTAFIDSDQWKGSKYDWNSYGQKTYVFRKNIKTFGHYDTTEKTPRNVKVIRMWGLSAAREIQYPNFYFSMSNGRVGVEGVNPSTYYSDFELTQQQREAADGFTNTWWTDEILMKSNSASQVADADLQWYVNGGDRLVYFPHPGWKTFTISMKNDGGDTNDARMRRLFAVHYVIEGDGQPWIPSPAQSWYGADDVYVDDSWCRVVVQDAADYTKATQREIQIVSSWSDKEIGLALLRKGQFASLSGKHVFVVNNDDVRFYVGSFQ